MDSFMSLLEELFAIGTQVRIGKDAGSHEPLCVEICRNGEIGLAHGSKLKNLIRDQN